MSSGSDPVWDVRGGGGLADHREGGNVQGEDNTEDIMNIMRGGYHSGFFGSILGVDAWEGTSD